MAAGGNQRAEKVLQLLSLRTIFVPAIALLERLRYPQKLGLIGLLLAVPLGWLAGLLISQIQERMESTRKEIDGVQYLAGLREILQDLEEHRALAHRLRSGNLTVGDRLAERQREIERHFDDLAAIGERPGARLGTAVHLNALRQRWREIEGKIALLGRQELFEEHTALISDLLLLDSKVGESSSLAADPDPDTHDLMEALVYRIPTLIEYLGQAMGKGGAIAERGKFAPEDADLLSSSLAAVQLSSELLTHQLRATFEKSNRIRTLLAPETARCQVRIGELISGIRERLARGDEAPLEPGDLSARAGAALEGVLGLSRAQALALESLLRARLGRLYESRAGLALLAGALILGVIYLLVAFHFSVMRTVVCVEAAARRMTNGESPAGSAEAPVILPGSRDEVAQAVSSFNAAADRLTREWREARRESRRAGEAEAQLRRKQEESRRVVENALDGVITIDSSGAILEWNPQAEAILGWTRQEVLGKKLEERIIPERYREAHLRGLRTFLETGKDVLLNRRTEVTALHRSGREFPAELSITPSRSEEGYTFCAFLRDITARKQLEEDWKRAKDAAEVASQAKSRFMANISHEIRTPLNAIIGMTALTLESRLDAEQRELLETVQASSASLLAIINDILDFSSVQAGRLRLDPHPFNLRERVGRIATVAAQEAARKGLELGLLIRPQVPEKLVGDGSRLAQILLNLLANAIKFTDEGEILLQVELDQGEAEESLLHFSVSDTGIGVPADKVAKIFVPFSQVDDSMTRRHGGCGLGLALSAKLVELMGGRIWTESQEGRGSIFHFTARLRVEAPRPAIPHPSLAPFRETRVLVVDSRVTSRLVLRETIQGLGLEPELARGGEAALEALSRARGAARPFAAVIVDSALEGMDPLELIAQISESKETPIPGCVLLLPPTRPMPQGDHAREAGIAAFLRKPVQEASLVDAILRALGGTPEGTEREAQAIAAGAGPPEAAERPHPDGTEFAGAGIPGESRTGRGHVLLAEDNPINEQLVVRLLERHGYTVAVARNGREAVDACKRERFDLILMDIEMPLMNGLEATAWIRDRERDGTTRTPIVALTAHAMVGHRERCLEAGMDHYLSKPIQTRELIQAIEGILAAAAAK